MAAIQDKQKVIRTSKYLSFLLRHGADQNNLKMSSDGFVSVNSITNLPQSASYKITLELIKMIVESNDKKRFELKQNENSEWFIRACQGHSIKNLDEMQMMEPITDASKYPSVIHGTFKKFWPSIQNEGLKIMTRNHVHFATGFPKDHSVISGMRRSCDVFIELDLEKAIKDSLKFFVSSNGVILTSGQNGVVDVKYFKRVLDKNCHQLVWKVGENKV